jgi:benzoyl-CoA reductase/2-hydroxyglutaryl-CoA dehydratase subunit BcrC/BadD/HgdB
VDEALKGSYGYLDGLIFPYTCEHARAAYDSWRINLPISYTRFIDMPSQTDLAQAEEFFVEELKSFCSGLESAFGASITEGSLRDSIKLHNRSRSLLKEMCGFKATPEPVVSGGEVFAAIMSSTVFPREEHNRLMEDALKELSRRSEPAGTGPRLMAVGTEVHDPDVIKAIEEAGARLVADELCTGTRLVWENVDEDGEPLAAIARRYLSGINCPVKRPAAGRMAHLEAIAEEYGVEGVVVLHPRHCDPNEWDMPFIESMLKEKDIPVVRVELDQVFSPQHVKDAVGELKEKL